MKTRLFGALLTLCAKAALAGETPRVAVKAGFVPNPIVTDVDRAAGGQQGLGGFVTCAGAESSAMVSKTPVLILDVADPIARLDLQATNGDRVVARTADGATTCGEKALVLAAKPGAIELYLVTATNVGSDARGKVRVFDADRPRALPATVKSVAISAKLPATIEGELQAPPATLPDAQLAVAADLDVKWMVYGAAAEVWISSLGGEPKPPVKLTNKLTDQLNAGTYAVWIRGATPSARGAFSVVALPQGTGLDPLKYFSKPAADAAIESRVLTAFMPGFDPENIKGWSQSAQALRLRAFTELPADFYVFASADGEVLLPLAVEAAEISVIAADGATFSLPARELASKPGSSGALVRPGRPELLSKLGLTDLAPETDARLKAFDKQKKVVDGCITRHPEWPDAPVRCNQAKLDTDRAKLEADLKKAFEKKRDADLALIDKHVKAVVAAPTTN